jgi:hypothetical protein
MGFPAWPWLWSMAKTPATLLCGHLERRIQQVVGSDAAQPYQRWAYLASSGGRTFER